MGKILTCFLLMKTVEKIEINLEKNLQDREAELIKKMKNLEHTITTKNKSEREFKFINKGFNG